MISVAIAEPIMLLMLAGAGLLIFIVHRLSGGSGRHLPPFDDAGLSTGGWHCDHDGGGDSGGDGGGGD